MESNGLRSEPKWARIVSNLFIPTVAFPVLGLFIAFHSTVDLGRAFLLTILFGGVGFILPTLYIIWLLRQGSISDLHIANRKERIGPFIVAVLGMAVALVLLGLLDAPRVMLHLALFTVLQSILITSVTFFWQISVHGACESQKTHPR